MDIIAILIKAMNAAGYWYDEINSDDAWLTFNGDYCTTMHFDSWDAVEMWLNGVVFDDPDVSDAVEAIMWEMYATNDDHSARRSA